MLGGVVKALAAEIVRGLLGGQVTAAEWMAGVPADVPERLVARVREVLAAHPTWGALPASESLVSVADEFLRTVLVDGEGYGAPRDRALDLLAADACVTWAPEAAADRGRMPPRPWSGLPRW